MIRAAALATLCLAAALPVTAQDTPLLEADYFGQRILIYPDNTWAFADPGVSLADAATLSNGGCLADERLSFCGLPEGLTLSSAINGTTSREFTYLAANGTVTLKIFLYPEDGHTGRPEAYVPEGLALTTAERIAIWSLEKATGVALPEETAIVKDDIVVMESRSTIHPNGLNLRNYSIEMIGESEMMLIDLATATTSAPPEEGDADSFERIAAALAAHARIDATSLADWRVAPDDQKD